MITALVLICGILTGAVLEEFWYQRKHWRSRTDKAENEAKMLRNEARWIAEEGKMLRYEIRMRRYCSICGVVSAFPVARHHIGRSSPPIQFPCEGGEWL